ncbi:type VII secretion protein EccB [Lentzea sp. NBRC 105346]|uniref:type VII secretion protein EccB n=1 Tax=Lentzea sp. NBRC 105346 TaxID=3032205 RepID=UPI0025521610|nr:type VII secretion protein EccB [Lentzea sp. NBRC 105346]GLZ30492.1 type VII secretion protein EccB [Lentzea sp. NBRC 105346]
MASTPTTKSQVQAYRFVLRRMQSALVRRDAVMLHDPMRNHSRATAVGVLLGIVGLLGFLVFGFFKPQPRLDSDTQIAISKETGQVYVVSTNPNQLIPMTNLASARLLWYQKSNPDAGGAGGTQDGGSAAAGGTSGEVAVAGGTPKLVSEAALAKMPKGRLTGIPDAPDVLPGPSNRIGAEWSVCDTLDLDEFRKNPSIANKIDTTVIAGVAGGDQLLDGENALLVQSKTNDKAYLIYKKPDSLTSISSTTVRAQVDLKKDPVKAALKLSNKPPRAVSNGLLNAIPEVAPLSAPIIPKQGSPASYIEGASVKIGEVVEVNRTGASEYFVVLEDGLQHVEPAVGDLIQFTYQGTGTTIREVTAAAVANHLEPKKKLKLEEYPAKVPTVLEPNANNTVVCLGWRADNVKEGNKSENTKVTLGAGLPVSKDAVPVAINQVGSTGEIVNKFVMVPGKTAVVRGSQNITDFGKGPIHIVTGRGVKYGVPDKGTAEALGLGNVADFPPAPESILRLLPNGPQLNRNDAIRSYDAIPVPKDAGQLPTQQQGS